MTDTIATVRIATVNDAAVLASLRYRFRSETGTPLESREKFITRCRAWMTTHLRGDNRWFVWIAEKRDRICGHVWIQLVEKVPNPVDEAEQHAYVTNLYVIPEARGEGIGGALLSAALTWCRGAGVHSAFLWTRPESRVFYQRYGFLPSQELLALVVSQSGKANPTR